MVKMTTEKKHREIDLQFELHPDCISAYVEDLKGEVFEQESVKFIEYAAYEELKAEKDNLEQLNSEYKGLHQESKRMRSEISALKEEIKSWMKKVSEQEHTIVDWENYVAREETGVLETTDENGEVWADCGGCANKALEEIGGEM